MTSTALTLSNPHSAPLSASFYNALQTGGSALLSTASRVAYNMSSFAYNHPVLTFGALLGAFTIIDLTCFGGLGTASIGSYLWSLLPQSPVVGFATDVVNAVNGAGAALDMAASGLGSYVPSVTETVSMAQTAAGVATNAAEISLSGAASQILPVTPVIETVSAAQGAGTALQTAASASFSTVVPQIVPVGEVASLSVDAVQTAGAALDTARTVAPTATNTGIGALKAAQGLFHAWSPF